MVHTRLPEKSRVSPESVGQDVARLIASTYASLLEEHVPDSFAGILGRIDAGRGRDVAQRLIDAARSGGDDELTWASYKRQGDVSRFVDPRWRMKHSVRVQH